MSNLEIKGESLPGMPWEDRPADYKHIMWRCTANPIIGRDALSTSNSIFNSAVVPFKKGRYNYAGVFRCDDTNIRMRLHVGFSVDGLKWDIAEEDIRLEGADPEVGAWVYGYDPRVVKLDGRYYVTWCNGYQGEPTIGIAWTDDFETFHQLENAFLPYNRNGVLFPRKIGGRYAMLSRPSDKGHTPFGDIYYSESPDLEFWGRHRLVMRRSSATRPGSARRSAQAPCPSRRRRGGCSSTTACTPRATASTTRSARRFWTSTNRGKSSPAREPTCSRRARSTSARATFRT